MAFHVTDVILNLKRFSVSDDVMSMDQTLLRYILENHILKLKVTLGELYNGQQLETLAGKLIRVFIYRTVSSGVFHCESNNSRKG